MAKTYNSLTLLVCLCIALPVVLGRSPSPASGGGHVRSGRWAAWAGSASLNATLATPNAQFASFNVFSGRKVANLTLLINCQCEGTTGIYSSLILRQHYTDFIPGTINSRGQMQSSFLDKSEPLWTDGPTRGWAVEITFDFNTKRLFVGIDHVGTDSTCSGSTFMRMADFGLPYWGSGVPVVG